jgi:hypothetical protein
MHHILRILLHQGMEAGMVAEAVPDGIRLQNVDGGSCPNRS